MSKDAELKARRIEIKDKISQIKKYQSDVWDTMIHRVQGGYDRVQEKRLSWVERQVQNLASAEAPVLWETVFGLFTTAIPVAGIVKWLLPHSQRAFKIGKITGFINAEGKVLNFSDPKWAKFINQFEKTYVRKAGPDKWVREVVEYNKDNKIVSLYTSEIEDSLRDSIRSAASNRAKYTVNKSGTEPGRANPSLKEAGDSVNFKTSALDWLSKTKSTEALTLELLSNHADSAENLKELEIIEALFNSKETWSKVPTNFKNASSFERWIETCVWIMTWDFGCVLRPARREYRAWGANVGIPTHIDLPPLGDDFWKYAVNRYYDPSFADGDSTFADIPIIPSLPPSRRKENYGFQPKIPDQEQATNKGFYPQERLAWTWGNVIAPELFRMNDNIAKLMTGQLLEEPELPPWMQFYPGTTYPGSSKRD